MRLIMRQMTTVIRSGQVETLLFRLASPWSILKDFGAVILREVVIVV